MINSKKILENLDLKTILILVLILIIIFMRSCSGESEGNKNVIKVDGKKYEVIKYKVDTFYKPVIKTVIKEGKTIYKEVPIYVNVPATVDTFEILKDYFSKHTYKDTLKLDDSLGYIVVIDTIFKNRIHKRKWKTYVNKITIKETLYLKELPKTQVYVGGAVGFDKASIVNFAGPQFILKDKKDRMYMVGVGYSNNKTISIQVGTFWKIKLKKDK